MEEGWGNWRSDFRPSLWLGKGSGQCSPLGPVLPIHSYCHPRINQLMSEFSVRTARAHNTVRMVRCGAVRCGEHASLQRLLGSGSRVPKANLNIKPGLKKG